MEGRDNMVIHEVWRQRDAQGVVASVARNVQRGCALQAHGRSAEAPSDPVDEPRYRRPRYVGYFLGAAVLGR